MACGNGYGFGHGHHQAFGNSSGFGLGYCLSLPHALRAVQPGAEIGTLVQTCGMLRLQMFCLCIASTNLQVLAANMWLAGFALANFVAHSGHCSSPEKQGKGQLGIGQITAEGLLACVHIRVVIGTVLY